MRSTEVPSTPPAPLACAYHPDRPAGVRCQRCGAPICGECMIEAPVGFQCPACVASATAHVRTGRPSLRKPGASSVASFVMIGINVAIWLAIILTGGDTSPVASALGLNLTATCDVGSDTYVNVDPATCAASFGLWLPGVQDGAWWKLLSSGFTHLAIVHLGFNMVVLGMLGPQMDRLLGTWRFLALYGSSILGGSLFALLLSPINTFTVGASGGLFGLMGGLLIIALLRHGDARTILIWLVVNVVFTFAGGGSISWQAHLGGLIFGAITTYALMRCAEYRARIGRLRRPPQP